MQNILIILSTVILPASIVVNVILYNILKKMKKDLVRWRKNSITNSDSLHEFELVTQEKLREQNKHINFMQDVIKQRWSISRKEIYSLISKYFK